MFTWKESKNQWLLANRNITFEHVVVAIESGGLLGVLEHPNQKRYGNQKILAVKMNGYVFAVPFVETGQGDYLLKTVFPSRKLSKQFNISGDTHGAG